MLSRLRDVFVAGSETARLYFPFAVVAAVILAFGVLIGIGLGLFVSGQGMDLNDGAEVVEENRASDGVPELSASSLFVHNSGVGVLIVVGGLYTVGVGTAGLLVLNGTVFGLIGSLASMEIGVGTTLLLLVPHGVFELPAIFFAAAIPFRFWWAVIQNYRREDSDELEGHVREAGRAIVLVGVLLLVAAAVEAWVTLPIAEAVSGVEL